MRKRREEVIVKDLQGLLFSERIMEEMRVEDEAGRG